MPITASNLVAKISDEGADATAKKMRGVGASVDETGAKIRNFALGAAAIGVGAIVGIGVVSTKMAGDFQSSMTSLVTGAGESEANLKMVSNGILNMAAPVGTTTKQLADGMYLIESAGQHGAQALQTLRDAAEGAKVGSADLGTVANGVTTIMTDYANANVSSAQATNTLIATVAAGKTHMGDLAASLAMILPTASAAGVSLNDVSAAMATMTGEGTPAADASTYLRQTIMSLINPSNTSASALANIGLTTKEVSEGIKTSLPDTLKLITDHLKTKFPEGSAAYVSALSDIAGGSKVMQGMLQLTGAHLDVFKGNVDSISKSVKDGGNSIVGWSKVQGDFNFKFQQAQEVVETLGIKIGTALLPVLGRLMDGFSSPAFQSFATILADKITVALLGMINGVTTLVNAGVNLTHFFQQNQVALTTLQPVLTTVAGVIGGVLVFAFWNWATAATAAAIATMTLLLPTLLPFIAIGALVGLVVGGIILAITHWSEISRTLKGAWQDFQGWYHGFLSEVQSKWNEVIGGLKTKGAEFISWFNTWKPIIEGVGGAITLFFLPAMIQAGVAATISGVQMTANFIRAAIMVGTTSAASGIQMVTKLVPALIGTGVSAATSAVQMVASFIPSIINSGLVSAIAAAQIAGNFVRSLIMTGVEGWQAAGKLGIFIAQMIVSKVQAMITGAAMVASFVAGLIVSGVQATISAGIFLSTLVPSLLAVAAGVIAATWPFLAIGAVVALVVVGIVLAIQHWADIVHWFSALWTTVWTAVSNFFIGIFTNVWNFLQKWGIDILLILAGPVGWIILFWSPITAFFSNLFGGIKNLAVNIFNGVIGAVKNAFNGVIDMIDGAIDHINSVSGTVGIHIDKIPHLAGGTGFFGGGLAMFGEAGPELVMGPSVGYLPRGARVIPASQTAQMLGGSSSNGAGQPIILVLDGHAVGRGLLPYQTGIIRNNVGVHF